MKRFLAILALALFPGGSANVAHATLHVADLTPLIENDYPGLYAFPIYSAKGQAWYNVHCPSNIWIIVGECKATGEYQGSDCDARCVALTDTFKSIRP